jgi:hypothetical protein
MASTNRAPSRHARHGRFPQAAAMTTGVPVAG